MIPGRPPESCQSKQRRNGWLETSASSAMLVSGGDGCVLVTLVPDGVVLQFPRGTSQAWLGFPVQPGLAQGAGCRGQPGCWVPHPEPNSECLAGGMLLGWTCRHPGCRGLQRLWVRVRMQMRVRMRMLLMRVRMRLPLL